jgi:A/G-specific adenine glycosylase
MKIGFDGLVRASAEAPGVKPVQRRLLSWYAKNGRASLPWRKTRDPYRILVSEFMLQQTQVDRVLPKYRAFIKRFPTIRVLAAASLADVIREWQGLGYNSRALRLKRIAEAVVTRFGGAIPRNLEALRGLKGIGPYTAAALRAFAFGCDDAAVDTNVRRVVDRLTTGTEEPQALVPRGRGHDWNSALMDFGATICTARAPKCAICPLKKVCASFPIGPSDLRPERPKMKAMPFERTTRFARGRIIDRLRSLPAGRRVSLLVLHRELALPGRSAEDVSILVEALARDGLVTVRKRQVALTD